ncbi:hypothetical protein [Streptomyces werraensis]
MAVETARTAAVGPAAGGHGPVPLDDPTDDNPSLPADVDGK